MSTNSNINTNTAQRRALRPPNLSDAGFYWTGEFDGADLVNRNGTNVPLVSGTGLDAIYDFGVLSDGRLDKGSYVGNAFALPENYDFPYPAEIYYDPTNATTRSYWKLKDFHYRFIQTQMDIAPQLINNIYFADLNYSATVLQNVSQLIIYNTEQTAGDLNKLLTIIGILPEFLGVEELTNGNFDTDLSGWSVVNFVWDSGKASLVSGTGSLIQSVASFVIGQSFRVKFTISDLTLGSYFLWVDGGYKIVASTIQGIITCDFTQTGADKDLKIVCGAVSTLKVDNVSVKELFQNYYKNEA